ncbi:UDP-2,3-diacylglucosamine diphosphatase [Geobacter pickeringii]|uniref:UDP-2,3-diacylglucosamine diphosphatase n=1 Tax=Geobacter pickeringii TaxID=345632 RepID=UPI001F284A03|nr:UDP-2,3-diacylglucosamine diphosphatase [Geobacter pickeringii]
MIPIMIPRQSGGRSRAGDRHFIAFTFARLLIYSAAMRTIFIADAHLRHEDDRNYRLLMEFLAGLRGTADTLYILGDLFEFWIGYRQVPFTHYLPLLDLLRELTASGVRLVYLEGNHDFHLGPFFTETLGVSVHPGPVEVELGGKRVYLCHGDEVNRRDHSYRLLRFILHNRLIKAAVPLVPPPSPPGSRSGWRTKAGNSTANGGRSGTTPPCSAPLPPSGFARGPTW